MRHSLITGRRSVLLVFTLATLALLGAGVLVSLALLRTSLYRAAEQEAGGEARLVANLGLDAALSHGPLSSHDLRLAASQYSVARKDAPLTGAVVWLRSGRAVFAAGAGRADAHGRGEPPIARRALTTGRTQVAAASAPRGSAVEAAVPLGARARDAVVEFHFARGGIERNLGGAERHLYLLTALAALVMFLAILPLLAWLAKRVSLPVDPVRRAATAELAGALTRRELIVHYQPKVHVRTGKVVGVEALVRWHHPRRGVLAPGEFLPVAERSPELLRGITHQVLECALRDCAAWLRDGLTLPVAVNVAPVLLLDGSLVTMVYEALRWYELDPRMLTLELTESALMAPHDDVTVPLGQLRASGIAVSMDDFGTGNSSLARLRSLPLDELKIDRSFIAGIATDERDLGITRHVVQLGVDLGLHVVAEGVEDRRTMRILRNIGCDTVQGFYFSKPLPEAALRLWLEQEHPTCDRDTGPAGPVVP